MADWLAKLFARSPFGPFQDHMRKVHECVALLPDLIDVMETGDMEQIRDIAKKISSLEHDADEIKNSVRDQLPKTLFLPVDRRDLLDVLSSQDAIADEAEDVAVVATMRPLIWTDELKVLLRQLLDKVMETAKEAAKVVEGLDELVESSFAGTEVNRIHEEINRLGRLEHEADKIQDQLTRKIYELSDEWSAPDFYIWTKIIQELSDVANASERMGNRLRTIVTR